uniref:Cytochrome P450 n=3 Tax=Photinus pyralis TaxID=7054 RepID=A0A1Y1L7K9_PHOPY
MIIIAAVFLLGFIFAYYLHVKRKHEFWQDQGVPHPKPVLLFGNIIKMITLQCTLSEFLNSLYRNYQDSPFVGFYNFLTPAIVLRDPEVIEYCLVKNFDSFSATLIRPADPIVKLNPFFCEERMWKALRKLLAPNFSSLKIKLMLDRMERVGKNMTSYLEGNNCSIRADELAFMFTGNNVMVCAYGVDNESFLSNSSIMNGIRDSMSMGTMPITHTLGLFFPNLCKMLNISYMGKQVPESFKNLIARVVEDRKVDKKEFVDFLKESKMKNDLTFLGHAMAFFLDGYETSANLLTYALLELARNPSVQIQAQNELDDINSAKKSIYSYEALKDMSYLESVVFETLRKHPVIKFLNRSCTNECLMPLPNAHGNERFVRIKKGTQVFIPVEAIHRDAKYYLDPHQFNPLRFSETSSSGRTKHTFLGFGYGPRICLGQQFAVTQLKVALASILLHFTISINDRTTFPLKKEFYHLTKFPKNKIWLNFTARHVNEL